jgi:hypothetical protein
MTLHEGVTTVSKTEKICGLVHQESNLKKKPHTLLSVVHTPKKVTHEEL